MQLFSWRATRSLIALKTRLILNSALSRGTWGIAIILVISAIVCWSGYQVSLDVCRFLEDFHRNFPAVSFDLKWILAVILAYLVLFTILGDLLLGHTLNITQSDSDYNFLAVLPVPPMSLLAGKLYERTITDFSAPILLLSTMAGVAFIEGFRAGRMLILLTIYIQLELLIGLFIIILTAMLRRAFKPSNVNNLFSILNYMTILFVTAPSIMIGNDPNHAISWFVTKLQSRAEIIQNLLTPFKWVVDSVVSGDLIALANWTTLWIISILLGSIIFAGIYRLNWLNFVHSGGKYISSHGRRILKGIYRKDILLLKNDFNILTNGLLIPITVICILFYQIRNSGADIIELATPTRIMFFFGFAIIYFCMFGPMNAIGSEKGGITLVETLPIRPGTLIHRKTIFWFFLLWTFFLPIIIASAIYLKYPFSVILTLVCRLVPTSLCWIWLGVSMSVLFAVYDGKILQQSSTISGKLLAFAAMLSLLPSMNLEFSSALPVLSFVGLCIALHLKAVSHLEARTDKNRLYEGKFTIKDAILIGLVTALIKSLFYRIHTLVSGENSGYGWTLWISYFSIVIIMIKATLDYVQKRFQNPFTELGFRKTSTIYFFLAIASGFALSYAGITLQSHTASEGYEMFRHSFALWQDMTALAGSGWPATPFFLFFCLIGPIGSEMFYRGFIDKAFCSSNYRVTGLIVNSAFFSMSYDFFSIPAAFILGMLYTLLFRRSGSLWPVILAHSIFNTTLLLIQMRLI